MTTDFKGNFMGGGNIWLKYAFGKLH